jgi:hypothetical protein
MESADDRIFIEKMASMQRKQHPEFTDKEILSTISNEQFRPLEFRSRGDAFHTKQVINELYKKAKKRRP